MALHARIDAHFTSLFATFVERLKALRRLADDRLKPDLEAVEGSAAVKVSGGYEDEVQVFVDQQKLAQLGLSIDAVVVRQSWLKAYDFVTDRAANQAACWPVPEAISSARPVAGNRPPSASRMGWRLRSAAGLNGRGWDSAGFTCPNCLSAR